MEWIVVYFGIGIISALVRNVGKAYRDAKLNIVGYSYRPYLYGDVSAVFYWPAYLTYWIFKK